MITVAEARLAGRRRLAQAQTPGLDADLLLAHVLGSNREHLIGHDDRELTTAETGYYFAVLDHRGDGKPVSQLVGHKSWFGLDLLVSESVLSPRPETETVVEKAIEIARISGVSTIADVGTGSGAIAIAMARSLHSASITAIDVSGEALEIARQNVARHNVAGRVRLIQGDLIGRVQKEPGMIVANLPYLAESERTTVSQEVLAEPDQALFGGMDGLELIERLLRSIALRGWTCVTVLEVDPRQVPAVRSLIAGLFPMSLVDVHHDLANRERIVVLRNHGSDTLDQN